MDIVDLAKKVEELEANQTELVKQVERNLDLRVLLKKFTKEEIKKEITEIGKELRLKVNTKITEKMELLQENFFKDYLEEKELGLKIDEKIFNRLEFIQEELDRKYFGKKATEKNQKNEPIETEIEEAKTQEEIDHNYEDQINKKMKEFELRTEMKIENWQIETRIMMDNAQSLVRDFKKTINLGVEKILENGYFREKKKMIRFEAKMDNIEKNMKELEKELTEKVKKMEEGIEKQSEESQLAMGNIIRYSENKNNMIGRIFEDFQKKINWIFGQGKFKLNTINYARLVVDVFSHKDLYERLGKNICFVDGPTQNEYLVVQRNCNLFMVKDKVISNFHFKNKGKKYIKF